MDKLQNRLKIAYDPVLSVLDYTGITQAEGTKGAASLQPLDVLVGGEGFEPSTNGLKVRCSTPELSARKGKRRILLTHARLGKRDG